MLEIMSASIRQTVSFFLNINIYISISFRGMPEIMSEQCESVGITWRKLLERWISHFHFHIQFPFASTFLIQKRSFLKIESAIPNKAFEIWQFASACSTIKQSEKTLGFPMASVFVGCLWLKMPWNRTSQFFLCLSGYLICSHNAF